MPLQSLSGQLLMLLSIGDVFTQLSRDLPSDFVPLRCEWVTGVVDYASFVEGACSLQIDGQAFEDAASVRAPFIPCSIHHFLLARSERTMCSAKTSIRVLEPKNWVEPN